MPAMKFWKPENRAGELPDHVQPRPSSAITIGIWRNLEGGETTVARGAGLDWRLDVVLCRAWDGEDALPESGPLRPALVFRPLHFYAVDHRRLATLFEAWLVGLCSSRRRSGLPNIASDGDLLLIPHQPPWKTCLPIRQDDLLWRNFWRIFDNANKYYLGKPKKPKLLHQLLHATPYCRLLTAFPASLEKALGEPPKKHIGRPTSHTTSSVETTLHHALIATGVEPSRAAEGRSGKLGPLRARFVLELCARHHLVSDEDTRRQLRWRWPRLPPEEAREKAARELQKAAKNLVTHALEGHRAAKGEPPHVRGLAPSIYPILDLAPHLETGPPPGTGNLYDALLVDWLRSEHAASLLHLALDAAPQKLQMRCCAGKWEDFLPLRHRPFHRQRVFFAPDDPDYLGAVAAVPGAQPGRALNMEITGFAEDPSELRTLWFGQAIGEVLHTHTVPAASG